MVRRCRLSPCCVSFARLLSSSRGGLNPSSPQLPRSGVWTTLLAASAILTLAGFGLPLAGQNQPSRQAIVPAPGKSAVRQVRHNTSTPYKLETYSPLQPDQYIYENGPINGGFNAWTVNQGFVVSDAFVVSNGGSNINGFSFGAWLMQGDVLTSAEVSITSSEFGGTSFFDQSLDFTQSNCYTNDFGFTICTETASFSGPTLSAGTYWVNLQNASVPTGNSVLWDQNSGDNCQSPGCPSVASENGIGTIPSESFTLSGSPGNSTTTTLLAPSSSPAGQPVTLEATVRNQAGTLVTIGSVTFFSGEQVLGTVQANGSSGFTAALKTRFGPGSYSLTAQYKGNDVLLDSQSSAEPLTVSGTEPTVSTLSVTPAGPNYDFTLSVSGSGNAPLSGTATLNNLTNGVLLGNILVPTGASTFLPESSKATGLAPVGVVVADFNGDGYLDIAVTNNLANNVGVLLGNRDGTFQTQLTSATGAGPTGIVAWDFDADGVMDLAVANASAGNVSILKGTGQGTFTQTTASLGPTSSPFALVVGDFNNDGMADLAVTDTTGNGVWILLGRGDGTFNLQDLYPVGSDPMGIAVGDFNGDGNADLAVTNFHDGTVSVLLGNGDGTFRQQMVTPVGGNPLGIAVADFTLDGKLDLVVANLQDDTISVLRGNGDGTFPTQQTRTTGSLPYGVVVADFNGDGFPDIAVSNSADAPGNSVSVLLNDTQGSFGTQQSYPVGVNPYGIAAGDFDGNGAPDLATANNGDNTTSVLLGDTVATAQLNNIQVCGVGDQSIQSSFSPNGAFYFGSVSNTVSVMGCGLITSTTTLGGSPNPSPHLQPVNFTASVTVPPGGPAPSGTVTFTDTFNGVQTTLCSGVQLNQLGTAGCSTATLACGTHSQLVARYSGDKNYLPSVGTDNPPQVVTGCGDFTVHISPASVEVTQTYNNNNDPFHAQAINLTVQPLNGYSNPVQLSCSVSPVLNGGSCTVNPPTSGLLAAGNLSTTLTISVGGTTPTGPYTVTIQAQDDTGLMHSATLGLTVDEKTTGLTMVTGGAGPPVPVIFGPGPAVVTNFSCSLVSGTGITGTEDFGLIGGVCSFNQTTTSLPDPVVVTITGCTIAQLGAGTRIYASLWFGLPGVVLLGSFRRRPRPGKELLRWVGLFLALLVLLAGVGCGGVGQTTPSGSYLVLVQGTGADGTVYSAVIPVTVTPLGR